VYQQYSEIDIQSASPTQIVVRLYEGAIKHCRTAAERPGPSLARDRGESVTRALAIVSELRSALDFEQGGEIARNLDALYAFASERMLGAHVQGSSAGFEEAARVLDQLLGAWRELAANAPEVEPRASAPAAP
jgi:flagellar protein FliS